MLPSDAQPLFGEYRDFLHSHYKVSMQEVDSIAQAYDIRCSPHERRLLFPYWFWPKEFVVPKMLAVWGRALPPYDSMSFGEHRDAKRPRYYIEPRDARPLYVPRRRGAYNRVIITEGAMDAIKANEALWTEATAVSTYGVNLSDDMVHMLQALFADDQELAVVYDTGAYDDALQTAATLRQRFPNTRAVRFPTHKDFGNATTEQIQQWYATSF